MNAPRFVNAPLAVVPSLLSVPVFAAVDMDAILAAEYAGIEAAMALSGRHEKVSIRK